MQKLTLNVLKQYNEWYDYALTEEKLREMFKYFSDGYSVSENEILEELENYAN